MKNIRLSKVSYEESNIAKIIYNRELPIDTNNVVDDLQPMLFRAMGEKNVHYFVQGNGIKAQRASKFLDMCRRNEGIYFECDSIA